MRKSILALLLLAACGPVVEHDETGEILVCPAPAFQDFVGQPYVNTLFNWPSLRIIRPGDAVTEDYRTDRLNIDLDDAEVITRIWCG